MKLKMKFAARIPIVFFLGFIWGLFPFTVNSAQQTAPKDLAQTQSIIGDLEAKLNQARADIEELERMIRVAAKARDALKELTPVDFQGANAAEIDKLRAQSLSNAFREAAKKVIPATVKILAHYRGTGPRIREGVIPRNIPGLSTPPAESMGAGVIIDSKGIVLTNNHVVDGARSVEVELSDGRKYKVVDVKSDPKTDIAVLWMDTKESLPSAELGNSDILDIGDWVLAIGNPFELDSTVSAGIISAKGRTLRKVERGDFLQTDASVNPGNSGGPLINLNGEVVGINTAIASASGGNQGIGFAIPSNTARWIVAQLVSSGMVVRAYLGVETVPITAELAEKHGAQVRRGVLVDRVLEDTPGEKGGVHRNDIILAFDGVDVNTPEELQKVVEKADINKSHVLNVIRDKKPGKIELNVARLSEEQLSASPRKVNSHSDVRLGILVIDFTEEMAAKYKIKAKSGVVIVDVIYRSVADIFGLQVGMVIEKIDDLPIENTKDYEAARRRGPLSEGFDFDVITPEGKKRITVKN